MACIDDFSLFFLLQGGDLFDAIASKKRFEETDASCMIRDMACALVYLHQMSIAHRDVKPENLLVRRNLEKHCISLFSAF